MHAPMEDPAELNISKLMTPEFVLLCRRLKTSGKLGPMLLSLEWLAERKECYQHLFTFTAHTELQLLHLDFKLLIVPFMLAFLLMQKTNQKQSGST